jgi:hypothetical protein
MARNHEAVAGNREVLEQAARLLRQLSDAAYADGGAGPATSAIGVHFRHVLDHYRALVNGLAGGRIDYEARQRRGELERDRGLALEESHTVHHFALIRALLRETDVDPGDGFGVAPSTVTARRLEASGARGPAPQR